MPSNPSHPQTARSLACARLRARSATARFYRRGVSACSRRRAEWGARPSLPRHPCVPHTLDRTWRSISTRSHSSRTPPLACSRILRRTAQPPRCRAGRPNISCGHSRGIGRGFDPTPQSQIFIHAGTFYLSTRKVKLLLAIARSSGRARF